MVIRYVYVGFTVCRTKKKKKSVQGRRLGWAIAPFLVRVATQHVVSQQAGPGERSWHVWLGARPSKRAHYSSGTLARHVVVALCRDIDFCVMTWLGLGPS